MVVDPALAANSAAVSPEPWHGTMPGKAAVTVALPGAAAPQKSYPFVLKKIMDIPPPNILEDGDDGKLRMSISLEFDRVSFFI